MLDVIRYIHDDSIQPVQVLHVLTKFINDLVSQAFSVVSVLCNLASTWTSTSRHDLAALWERLSDLCTNILLSRYVVEGHVPKTLLHFQALRSRGHCIVACPLH